MQKRLQMFAPSLLALLVLLAGSAFIVRADSHDDVWYACLFAGSLSQVNNTAAPANCGRGINVSWSGSSETGFNYTYERHGEAVRSQSTFASGGPEVDAIAVCDEGDVATGGGMVVVDGTGSPRMYASQGYDSSVPDVAGDSGTPDGWLVRFSNAAVLNTYLDISAVAICTGTATADQ